MRRGSMCQIFKAFAQNNTAPTTFTGSIYIFVSNQQTAIIPTANILRVLHNHPAQNNRPLLKHHRFQHSHMYKTLRPNKDPDHDNPQSPLTYALHNVARSLNILSSHYSLANPLPTDNQLYNRHIRVTTMYPCPALHIATQGNPRMCEHYNILRSALYHTSPHPQP